MARKNWIVVASADHVSRGRTGGFMQACHGKAAPLRRIRPGDVILAYSPSKAFRGKEKCQSFTGLGVVAEREPYQADMGQGFHPFRRDVRWLTAHDAPIAPLLDELYFTAGKRSWGYQLRFGVFEVSDHDMRVIATAMGAPDAPA
jgi:hypothetical protein